MSWCSKKAGFPTAGSRWPRTWHPNWVTSRSSSNSPGGGSPPLLTVLDDVGPPPAHLERARATPRPPPVGDRRTTAAVAVLDPNSSGVAGPSWCCRSFRSPTARPSIWASFPPTTRCRGAIVADIDLPGAAGPLRVVGTHLAHLSQGSPRHIAALRRTLNAMTPVPSVLAGDMNLWGPPLVLLLPGWSRGCEVVHGRRGHVGRWRSPTTFWSGGRRGPRAARSYPSPNPTISPFGRRL